MKITKKSVKMRLLVVIFIVIVHEKLEIDIRLIFALC